MSNDIPSAARTAVRVRAHFRCQRCLAPAPNGQWHHRRSRSVHDEHTHCVCNGVWLCATCHRQVHAFPTAAQQAGFIVSRFETEPGSVSITSPLGNYRQDCRGKVVFFS